MTQPGKIALIYFDLKDIQEYPSNIEHLQSKGILEEGIEYLELEEQQGVSGLKAKRVTVRMESIEQDTRYTETFVQELN